VHDEFGVAVRCHDLRPVAGLPFEKPEALDEGLQSRVGRDLEIAHWRTTHFYKTLGVRAL
jgi:hypothetical protein